MDTAFAAALGLKQHGFIAYPGDLVENHNIQMRVFLLLQGSSTQSIVVWIRFERNDIVECAIVGEMDEVLHGFPSETADVDVDVVMRVSFRIENDFVLGQIVEMISVDVADSFR